MIKALIFDLDDTLYPTKSITRKAVQPIIDAFIEANKREKLLNKNELKQFLFDVWKRPFNQVAKKYKLSPFLINTVNKAVDRFELKCDLKPYDDYLQIHQFQMLKFLVTTGHFAFQTKKIELLKIRQDFNRVVIDAINLPNRLGKKRIFEQLVIEHHLELNETLIIGDNPDSEIKAGNDLGVKTIQIIREGVIRSEKADFHIIHLKEIQDIMKRLA